MNFFNSAKGSSSNRKQIMYRKMWYSVKSERWAWEGYSRNRTVVNADRNYS